MSWTRGRSGSAALADRWLRVRPGCDLALLLGIAHVLIAEDLYDHEFVTRYTTGFDELAQTASAWTPEWAESMCDVPAAEIAATARDLAAAAPAAVWTPAFMAALASRMPTAPRPRARFVWSMCCWAASDTQAARSIHLHRLCWATLIPHVLRRRRCRAYPSWGPSAIHWSIRARPVHDHRSVDSGRDLRGLSFTPAIPRGLWQRRGVVIDSGTARLARDD